MGDTVKTKPPGSVTSTPCHSRCAQPAASSAFSACPALMSPMLTPPSVIPGWVFDECPAA